MVLGSDLTAGGDLLLASGSALLLEGVQAKAGGNATLDAPLIYSTPLSLNHFEEAQSMRVLENGAQRTEVHATRIEAGGDLTLIARNPERAAHDPAGPVDGIHLISTELRAGGKLNLLSDGDIVIEAINGGHQNWQFAPRRWHDESHVLAHPSQLEGESIVVSGRNVRLDATDALAVSHIQIAATENLSLGFMAESSETSLWQRSSGSGPLSKTKTTDTYSLDVTPRTSHLSAPNISLTAGGNIDLYAPQLHAKDSLRLIAGGELREYAVASRHVDYQRTEKSRSFLGIKVYGSEYSSTVEHDVPLATRLISQDTYSASGGDTVWLAPHITGPYRAEVRVGDKAREDARLVFQGAVERHYSEQHYSRSGALWMSAEGQGQTTETLHHAQMPGPFSTNAEHIEVHLPGTPEATLGQYSGPEHAWMHQLPDNVSWQETRLDDSQWSYSYEGVKKSDCRGFGV